MIHSYSDGRIEDTGPLTVKRMETVDEEFLAAGLDFMNRAVKVDKPFFVWMSASRMHVWTHLKKESEGTTGVGLYADGMVEHDGHVGRMLDKLKELGIEENTIVIYSTDNGAEAFTWPDGGNTPFHGEKGTTWEGGFRVPMMVRWPNVVKPGSKSRDIISQEDWLPTLLAAAGEPQIKEKLKRGHKANGKEWRVHLDGYNFMPRFKGEADKGPRKEIFYFDPVGNLNAVRFADWKVHFSTIEGNIPDSERVEKLWPLIVNLRADPYERIWEHATGHSRWAADNIWLFIPIQEQIAGFAATFADYPFQEGVSVGGEGLNYRTLRNKAILKELGDKGLLSRPGN